MEVINFNDPKFLADRVTKEQLVEKFGEEAIYKHYVGDYELGCTMKSPIRKGDDVPSFNIYYSKQHNCLLFKDFAGKRGDFVILVQELLGIPTYQQALNQIASDMAYQADKKPPKVTPENIGARLEKSVCRLRIIAQDWTTQDLEYWKEYGITLPTLKMFNVYSISGFYHNNYYLDTPDLAFAYLEYKDNALTYKIYRPHASKALKWRNNNPFGVHQGYMQLPSDGDLMIITKSLKDVMSLYEVLSIPAISVQSETCYMKGSVATEYKTRFKKVVSLFDNDFQGREQGDTYKRLYDIDPIFIPKLYNAKDFSDLVKFIGSYDAGNVLELLLGLKEPEDNDGRRTKGCSGRIAL